MLVHDSKTVTSKFEYPGQPVLHGTKLHTGFINCSIGDNCADKGTLPSHHTLNIFEGNYTTSLACCTVRARLHRQAVDREPAARASADC